MNDPLGGSLFLGFCKKIYLKIKETAKCSLLFGKKEKVQKSRSSAAVGWLNKLHPALALEKAIAKSGLFCWLYRYWRDLAAGPLHSVLFLLTPFCLGMGGVMLLAGCGAVAGGLLGLWGLAVLLLTRKGSIKEFLSGSFLIRLIQKRADIPDGTPRRSISVYLAICGVLGAVIGWKLGLILGAAAAVALAGFPIFFAVPPMGIFCLLMAVLPLLGTTVCWALSAALAVSYLVARAFGREQGRPLDKTDLLLLVFPVFCIASTFFSFDRMDSAKVTVMWLGLFLCVFFIRRIVTTRRRLISALTALAAGGAVSGLYGLYQYLSGSVNTTWTDTALFEDLQLRVYSTFANPNVFGEFLLLLIPLVTALIFYFQSNKLRLLMMGADLLLLVNLALTYSRGCYVGIAVTAVFFLWHLSKKWMVAILALGIPLGILLMPQSIADRLLSIGNMSDSSTSFRMMIYIGTVLMLIDYWSGGVGIGEGAYNRLYPLYAIPDVPAPHSHSLFFQSVVSFGIAGLAYLTGLLGFYQKRTGLARKAADGRDRVLMVAFNTVMWGMMVQSIFDYTWYNYRVFQLFWIVIVLGLSAAEIFTKQEERNG